MLATSGMFGQCEGNYLRTDNVGMSDRQAKAREKLKRLGLNEFQICKLIEFELNKQRKLQ